MKLAKVLLVEDEIFLAEGISKSLIEKGVTVLNASGAADALEKIERNPNLDVVVLDLGVSGIHGAQILKRIKDVQPLVEIILLTGHNTVGFAIDGMRLGAHDYVMKPCDPELIAVKVQDAKVKKSRQEAKIAEVLAMQIALHTAE